MDSQHIVNFFNTLPMNTAALKNELEILEKIYSNFKNHLKSSILLGRINEVRKVTSRLLTSQNTNLKNKLKECCLNLYVSTSNIYVMGHYKPLCSLLFAISARIYKVIDTPK